MQRMMQLLGVCLLAGLTASAQTYSQPIRDVDNPARMAVYGACNPDILAGQNNSVSSPCSLYSITGTNHQGVVPAGKILVIEESSAFCGKHSGDAWVWVLIGGGGPTRMHPMTLQSTVGTRQRWVSNVFGRLYLKGGQTVLSQTFVAASAQESVACTLYYTGHLVNAQ